MSKTLLQMEEAFTVKEYKHTNTHTHTYTRAAIHEMHDSKQDKKHLSMWGENV